MSTIGDCGSSAIDGDALPYILYEAGADYSDYEVERVERMNRNLAQLYSLFGIGGPTKAAPGGPTKAAPGGATKAPPSGPTNKVDAQPEKPKNNPWLNYLKAHQEAGFTAQEEEIITYWATQNVARRQAILKVCSPAFHALTDEERREWAAGRGVFKRQPMRQGKPEPTPQAQADPTSS